MCEGGARGEEKGTGYFPADVGTSEAGITIITNLGIGSLRACSQVGKNIQSNGAGSYLRAGIGMGEESFRSEKCYCCEHRVISQFVENIRDLRYFGEVVGWKS